MRIVLYAVIAVPLLVIDCLLLADFPRLVTRFYSFQQIFSILGGGAAYAAAHSFIRKPERSYLWAHELTHLALAKLFFKSVHGFHITSRDGGRVVIDGTNVWIDLGPYLFPLYNLLALGAASVFRPVYPWGTTAYLVGTGFLYAMHLTFSAEGFFHGQPDLRRSGRFFSLAMVLLFAAGMVPALVVPGVGGGWTQACTVYGAWGKSAIETARTLLLAIGAFRF